MTASTLSFVFLSVLAGVMLVTGSNLLASIANSYGKKEENTNNNKEVNKNE